MKSCIYAGRVEHRRYTPVEHAFRYRVFMLYLDLDELPRVFAGRWLWGVDRHALACFRRDDHLGDPRRALDLEVRDLVARETGEYPAGPVRILTHLRYFGWCFNPVSYYYCFDAKDDVVTNIVAEVHNTPWGERHCYVLPESENTGTRRNKKFSLPKRFHVSPFMPMEMTYEWRFTEPSARLAVAVQNYAGARRVFSATLALSRIPITSASLAGVLVRYPPMPARVTAGIYWQAFRLWLKQCPVYDHPRNEASGEANV